MADIFYPEDVASLLAGKHIAYLGGSVMRGLYKDLVWLLNDNTLIPREVLGAKGERNFPDLENVSSWKGGPPDDRLKEVFHENNRDDLMDYKGLTAGRTYIEPRKYYSEEHDVSISYKFISRVWSNALEDWLKFYEEDNGAALDIIVFNSCLWDVNRWGPFGPEEYKQKLPKLLELIPKILAPQGLFIWLTTPPGSEEIKSRGMNVPGLEFQCFTTRFNVIEANFFTAHKVKEAGFNVIDIHYYLQMQTFRRCSDGIHWAPDANRLITNMTLTHISLAGSLKLPGRVKDNYSLELVKLRADTAKQESSDSKKVKDKLKTLLDFANRVTAEKNTTDIREMQDIKEKALRKVTEMKARAAETSKRNEFKQESVEEPQINPLFADNVRFHPYEVPRFGRQAGMGMGQAPMGMGQAPLGMQETREQGPLFGDHCRELVGEERKSFTEDTNEELMNFNSRNKEGSCEPRLTI